MKKAPAVMALALLANFASGQTENSSLILDEATANDLASLPLTCYNQGKNYQVAFVAILS